MKHIIVTSGNSPSIYLNLKSIHLAVNMEFETIEPLSESITPGLDEEKNEYNLDAMANIGQVVSSHFDAEELDVFVWPWTGRVDPPHPSIKSIEELNEIRTVYSAGGVRSRQAKEFNRDEGHVSLDILENENLPDCLREEVVSHDVAELARNDKLDAIDIEKGFDVEYARDIGMELKYHASNEYGASFISKENYGEEDIDQIFEGVAEDSKQMVSDGGILIADLHDYSTSQSMAMNTYLYDPEEPWNSKKRHIQHIASLYDDKFEEVTPALMFRPESYFTEGSIEEYFRKEKQRDERMSKEADRPGLYADIEDSETFMKYRAKPHVIAKNPIKD